MADRIMLQFGANTSDVDNALRKTAGNLDDTRDALDDVGTAGENAGRSVQSGAEDAAAATDGLGESADNAQGKMGDLGRAGQQALEGDLGGAAQTAAGLLSDLGPVGAAAGAIAAAGIGLVTQKIKEQQEEAEKLQRKVGDIYKGLAEKGQAFIDEATIQSGVLSLLFGTEEERQKLKDDAASIGVDFNTYLRAQAGDYDAIKQAIDSAAQAEKDRLGDVQAANVYSQKRNDTELMGILAVKGGLEQLKEAHENNQAALELYNESQAAGSKAERDQIAKTKQADQERYEGIAAQISKLDGSKVQIDTTFKVDKKPVEDYLADLRRRRIPIVADLVDRQGKKIR